MTNSNRGTASNQSKNGQIYGFTCSDELEMKKIGSSLFGHVEINVYFLEVLLFMMEV